MKRSVYSGKPLVKSSDIRDIPMNQRSLMIFHSAIKSEQTKSLHVHHILSKSKYPEYVAGNYHGRTGNNFVCFCPFHHFAYHYTYATARNDKKHETALSLLWFQAEQWADKNKISIADLEIELAQMLPTKVILKMKSVTK